MKEALKLTSYANHPSRTPVLKCDRIIRKGNQTIKVMSKLANRNQIKRRIKNINDKSKGYRRKRTCRTDSFIHGLRSIIMGKDDVIVREEKRSLLPER